MKKRGWKYRLAQVLVGLVLLLAAVAWLGFLWPFWGIPFNGTRHTQVPVTPAWALECWLWEDDVNTADEVRRLVAGYEQYDIPARTVLIDSPWSTRYNDFIVDEARYPDPAGFFGDLQDRGYRVVLWMTSMVNSQSDDTAIPQSQDWYDEARSKGYLLGDGPTKWWKGRGGFIDYTNPDAMQWWRGLQQQVFDWGIDGWKLDGTATLCISFAGPVPLFYKSADPRGRGWVSTREYMDHYYRDEYRHGLTQNPEFITLARSIDGRAHPEGFAPFDAAPVTWVGDQDHTWSLKEEGFEEALSYIMDAARLGYCVIGSDVAGYGGKDIPPELYIRWAQFSTFCGLFLNGGHGNRALWERTPQELEVVRTFAWLHNELVPYMYTHVVDCSKGGKPLMRPSGEGYEYYFGDDFYVSPIHRPGDGKATDWKVSLPEGRWRYLFNDDILLEGPRTVEMAWPLNEAAVYVRDGAIVPLNVTRPYTGYGDRDSSGYLTLLVYPAGSRSFTVHHADGSGDTTVRVEAGEELRIGLEGARKPHILLVRSEKEPQAVTLDGQALAKDAGWRYDARRKRIVIKTDTYGQGAYVVRFG